MIYRSSFYEGNEEICLENYPYSHYVFFYISTLQVMILFIFTNFFSSTQGKFYDNVAKKHTVIAPFDASAVNEKCYYSAPFYFVIVTFSLGTRKELVKLLKIITCDVSI